MQMIHTPGPWLIGQPNTDPRIAYVTTQAGRSIADVWNVPHTKGEQALADARLISAAPDLLEALKQAVEALRSDDPNARMNALRDCPPVISKATGEPQ